MKSADQNCSILKASTVLLMEWSVPHLIKHKWQEVMSVISVTVHLLKADYVEYVILVCSIET